jgi:hypothetical protein
MKSTTTSVMVLLAVCYAACFLVLTFPLGLHLGSCFVSDAGGECRFVWQRDSCIFVWNIYNFADSIHNGSNPFFTHRIFYPYGTSLWLHVYAPLYGVVGLLTANPILALNLAVFASFVVSGLGAYLLCLHYIRRHSLSALAGFTFAFCPYKLLHLRNHYDLMLTATIPFFVLCFVKALEPILGRWPRLADRRYLAAALVCLAITFFSCYYYTFFLLVFAVLYGLYFRLRLDRLDPFSRRALRYWLVVVAASTVAMNLLKLVFHLASLDGHGAAENGLGGSSDLLAFLLPAASSRLLAFDLVRHVRLDVLRTNFVESTVYVGYAILVFAVAYAVCRQYRREVPGLRVVAFMSAVFLVLAMPVFRVADRTLFATPSALLHFIPFIDNFRAPYRYAVMVMLFLPILSCLFIDRSVLPRLPARARPLVVLGLGLVLFAEYWQQDYRLLCRADVPRVYEQLAACDEGVLLEIPFGLRDGFHWRGDERTTELFYQTVHHKPIIAGLVSRSSHGLFDRLLGDTVLAALVSMQEGSPPALAAASHGEVEQFLATFRVRYVLIHPEYRGSAVERYVKASFDGHIVRELEIDGFALILLSGG